MATLYVENVPDELYDALRKRAKRHRKSIAAEVIELLEDTVPTEAELERRRKLFEDLRRISSRKPLKGVQYQSAEEMLREDRNR